MILNLSGNEFAIGLDIGGTSIVGGIIDKANGKILSRTTIPTESRNGHADGLARLAALIEHVITDAHVNLFDATGIGIGCTGPVDSVTGLIQNPYTLPGWEDLPIVEYLKSRFGLRTCLLNDCHVAALGEYWMGAGKGSRHMIYITVGTGIGSGLILDGALFRGNGLLSGEFGHLAIDPNGPKCYCGAQGCLEMLASGPAIESASRHAVIEGSPLWLLAGERRENITAKIVCQAVTEGDSVALRVITEAATFLGIGIANLLNILTTEVVVLGGGVMQSWSLFQPTVEQVVKARSGMLKSVNIKLLPAALGLNAGITGAAYAVFQQINNFH